MEFDPNQNRKIYVWYVGYVAVHPNTSSVDD
jgi:hypothetical protein